MKKNLSLLLVLALVLSLSGAVFAAPGATVRPATQNFSLDGTPVEIDAYNVDGYNYAALRGLAAALNGTEKQFSVDYDAEANAVVIVTGAAYAPGDSGFNGPAVLLDDEGHVTNAVENSQSVVIDGERVDGLSAWNIGGTNYFKLAELRDYIGYGLDYDASTATVYLSGDGSAPAPAAMSVHAAADYAEIRAALTASRSGRDYGGMWDTDDEVAVAEEAEAEMPAASDASANGAEHSGTNVQVQGIDEGDIVKTDGAYIYVLNRSTADVPETEGRSEGAKALLTIVKADGENSEVVSRTAVGWSWSEYGKDADRYAGSSGESKYPREMFVSGGTLAILSNYSSYSEQYADDEWTWDEEQYLCVDFYDVSDPARPALIASLGQDGYLNGSRLLDGKLYVVSSYYVWSYDEDDPGTYVPVLYQNGEARAMTADCVYLCGESSEYVVVCAYDLAGASLDAAQSLLGSGDQIYMSGSNLYVLGSAWSNEVVSTRTESVYTVTERVNAPVTEIYRFDLSGGGLSLAASGTVPGYIDSQFSADEKGGCLRIVTTYDSNSYTVYKDEAMGFVNYRWPDEQAPSSSGLYVLDADLNVVGKIDGLAADEYVYAVRFDGDVAYFTTFRTVDPLFAVDVSDPANPVVLSALKITGFSEYLHAWTEDRLFGFGYEADEDTGRTKGLKLVMFDTSDKADVTAAHTCALPDLYYSEALYNHKAFFIDPAKNIIGFVGNNSEYYVFSYDDEAGFTELCHFFFDTGEYNVRGLWIGDTAYLVGQEQMMVVDMDTWTNLTGVKISD